MKLSLPLIAEGSSWHLVMPPIFSKAVTTFHGLKKGLGWWRPWGHGLRLPCDPLGEGPSQGLPLLWWDCWSSPNCHCSSGLLWVHGHVPLITQTNHYMPTSDIYPSVFSTNNFSEIQQQQIFPFRKSNFERNLKLREIVLWGTTIYEKDRLKIFITSEATSKTHVNNWKEGHSLY